MNALADDGRELWLKYRKIDDKTLLSQYRKALTGSVMPGQSATLRIIRDELKRSPDVMLERNTHSYQFPQKAMSSSSRPRPHRP
jgi:alpha-glucuronidase